jgi:DNA-binding winged helix-turn-helix (wHTH) protein/tetratricopeptide (TPR) repeat protein
MIYLLGEAGEFELDEGLYQLRRDGDVIRLAPRAFDVLLYLVRHRDHVVAKRELLDGVWQGEAVSESVLPSNVTALRKALGDERAGARMIQTVHGRGYRFVAPVEECAARAPGADAGPTQPGDAHDVPMLEEAGLFVGRDRVMEELHTHLARAVAGAGRLVFLVGEPGIGKTRTAEELAGEARAQDVRVLQGCCYEGEGAPAYWPWVQILRQLLRDFDTPGALREALGVGAADIGQLVPELRSQLPELPTPPDLQSEHARFRLFDSVATLLANVSRARPLLLVVDDLHWADAPTLLLLRFLARELREARVLLLGAYRDVEVRRHHPLAQIVGELSRESNFHRLLLRGLSAADSARFVEAMSVGPVSEAAVQVVYDMSEGNPFFLHETVRLFAAEGRLQPESESRDWGMALPQGVRDVIGRRLDTLGPECNRVLGLAAVMGRDFRLNVLQEVAELPAETLLELLDEAVAAYVVVAAGGGGRVSSVGQYSFCHALIRETLYEELSAPERVRMHRRVGCVLEAVYGADVEAHLSELAHHFFQSVPGGDVERAIEYGERAARAALDLLAYEEGIAHYQRALQALEFCVPVDEARRCELTLGLGWAQFRAGHEQDRLTSFRRAAELARRIARADLLAGAAMGTGGWPPAAGRAPMDENSEFRALVEEALAQLPSDDLALRARLLSALAVTPPDQDSMERRSVLSAQSVALARESGDPDALFDAYFARQWALTGPDDTEERLELSAAILELGEKLGAKERIFTGHEDHIRANWVLCDMAVADRHSEACERLAAELRLPRYEYSVTRFQLARAMGDGRFDEAEELLGRLPVLGSRAGESAGIDILVRYFEVWVRRERGELDQIDRAFFDAVAQDEEWLGSFAHVILAVFCGELGEEAARQRHFERLASRDFADIPRDENWLFILFLAADVCCELADARRASLLYPLLAPYAGLNVTHQTARIYIGSAHTWLARLAALCGQSERSTEHFEAALAMNQTLGALPALVRTRYAYAQALLGRAGGEAAAAKPRTSDARRASALLSQALEGAEATGMRALVRDIRQLEGA